VYGRDHGFEGCVENLRSPFFDARELPTLFERTGAVACLDTGHAHVSGLHGPGQADLLREHGDEIAHVHLDDTRNGRNDEHLPVGMGRVDLGAVAAATTETGWDGRCTHEVFAFDNAPRAFGKRQFDALLMAGD
jgi:sugar phosphate isomerase/epimerase